LEGQALDDIHQDAVRGFASSLKRPLIPDVNTMVTGPRLKRSREDHSTNTTEDTVEHVGRQSHSPTPAAWRNAPMGSWGRGSRM
jgi:hypothetical protein